MKTRMDFCLATFAALVVLLRVGSGSPTWRQSPCEGVRSSSLELNLKAKTASVKARNGSTDLANFSNSLEWIEAKDMCDPESLRQKPMACVGKIYTLLMRYRSEVERISAFQSCLEFASIVKPALDKLQRDMNICVNSLGELEQETRSDISAQPINQWKEVFMCHYTLDRLFSFSIFAARVFAVGDPTNHGEGSTQKCK